MLSKTLTAAAALFACAQIASAQDAPPFGSDEDIRYAEVIWELMIEERLAGDDMIIAYPYPGIEPHGLMLETFFTTAEVEGHTGALIVKRNYGDVSEDDVISDALGNIGALTIMFQREEGYDPENQNWFYAKYSPDGTLDLNPAGVALAGTVGKGAEAGCIACHQNSPYDNFLFTTSRSYP